MNLGIEWLIIKKAVGFGIYVCVTMTIGWTTVRLKRLVVEVRGIEPRSANDSL